MQNIKFWYAVRDEAQLTFDNTIVHREVVVGKGHIVYNEVLMCRASRNILQDEYKGKKNKTVAVRIMGVGVCEDCMDAFKKHPDLGWQKWVRGEARVVTGAPLKMHGVK